MAFKSVREAENRLVENRRLTEEEIEALFVWAHVLSEASMRRLNIEMALLQLKALHDFESSSGGLSIYLIVLTVVLTVCTGVITYYTILMARGR